MRHTFVDQIYERDIDLMVVEELHCSPDMRHFVSKFVFETDDDVEFLGAWNSISQISFGESDVIAKFKVGDRTIGVLFENKINAPFQPNQSERYRKRGNIGVQDNSWDEFYTVLLAPKRYIDSTNRGWFDHFLSYEEISLFLRARDDAHAKWRADILDQAVRGGSAGAYLMRPDANTTDFFLSVWELANREFPQLRMRRQEKRPRKSVWTSISGR